MHLMHEYKESSWSLSSHSCKLLTLPVLHEVLCDAQIIQNILVSNPPPRLRMAIPLVLRSNSSLACCLEITLSRISPGNVWLCHFIWLHSGSYKRHGTISLLLNIEVAAHEGECDVQWSGVDVDWAWSAGHKALSVGATCQTSPVYMDPSLTG